MYALIGWEKWFQSVHNHFKSSQFECFLPPSSVLALRTPFGLLVPGGQARGTSNHGTAAAGHLRCTSDVACKYRKYLINSSKYLVKKRFR